MGRGGTPSHRPRRREPRHGAGVEHLGRPDRYALPAGHGMDPALLRGRARGPGHGPDRVSSRRDGPAAGDGGDGRVLPLPHVRAGGHPFAGERGRLPPPLAPRRRAGPGRSEGLLPADAAGNLHGVPLQDATGHGGGNRDLPGDRRGVRPRLRPLVRDLRSRAREERKGGAARRGHDGFRDGDRARDPFAAFGAGRGSGPCEAQTVPSLSAGRGPQGAGRLRAGRGGRPEHLLS